MQRELERQPFIPPTLPMEQCQTLHLSDVGLACQASSLFWSKCELEQIQVRAVSCGCSSALVWFVDLSVWRELHLG